MRTMKNVKRSKALYFTATDGRGSYTFEYENVYDPNDTILKGDRFYISGLEMGGDLQMTSDGYYSCILANTEWGKDQQDVWFIQHEWTLFVASSLSKLKKMLKKSAPCCYYKLTE